MPLEPALKNLIEQKLAHAKVPQWEMPIEQVREAFARLWTPALTGDPVAVRQVEDRAPRVGRVNTPGLTCPTRPANPAIVMYFHGGGYVKGGVEETDAFCRRLAKSTGRIVASVGYRLAPENPFPAALDDAYAATSLGLRACGGTRRDPRPRSPSAARAPVATSRRSCACWPGRGRK